MKYKITFLFSILILLVGSTTVFNQTIYVPDDYSIIQEAINAADSGDVVIMREGTYYQKFNFMGKAIAVASEFLLDHDTSHISKTIIDGSFFQTQGASSIVTINSGEDTNSILCGLTLQKGLGTYGTDGDVKWIVGGAISLDSAGATIKSNLFRNNSIRASEIDLAIGGGIDCFSLPQDKKLIIDNNTFINNEVQGIDAWGGAINCEKVNGEVLISKNIIISNSVNASSQGNGGGICVLKGTSNKITISNNHISKNNVTGRADDGGGIFVMNNRVAILNNIITENSCSGTDHGRGGGISVGYWGNLGGDSTNMIANIINNSIINNSGTMGSGIYVNNMDNNIINNIIWGNSDPLKSQINIYGSAYEHIVEYSNIEGGYEGEGNIDADPEFSDTVLCYLTESVSPCIDAGNPEPQYNDMPDPDKLNNALFPALGGLQNDMGAYGGPQSKWDFVTDIEKYELVTPNKFILLQNYPNPFNPITVIKYSVPENSYVSLKIFDVLGSELITIVSAKQPSGDYQIEFDGSKLASGIYFYTLKTEKYIETKKMILLK